MSGKISVRLFDFRIYNEDLSENSDSDEEKSFGDKKETVIQMYGMNEGGETFAINVMNFKPFFYVKVPQFWDLRNLEKVLATKISLSAITPSKSNIIFLIIYKNLLVLKY